MIWTAAVPGGDAHAGRTETSLMLAIDPGAVRRRLAEAGCTLPLEVLMPRLRAEGVRPISSNGVLGDPQGATADEGEGLLAAMTDDLVGAVSADGPKACRRHEPDRRSDRGRARYWRSDGRPVGRPGWRVVAVDLCADDPSLDYCPGHPG